MLNADAVEVIHRHRGDAVVVTTMTTIFTYPDAADGDRVLRCAPLMGGASSIGLGIALARPEHRVLVLDGDGSLLMQLGSLATIAAAAPANLVHFVFHNGVLYEGGGRLPIATPDADFPALARAAGYPHTYSIDTAHELDERLDEILGNGGPALVRLAIDIPDTPPWSASNPHGELPDWWFTMMGSDARAVARTLGSDAIGP